MSSEAERPPENLDASAALERLRAEFDAARDAQDSPLLEAHRTTRLRLGERDSCPFPRVLLTKSFGFGGIPLSPEETARCLEARGRVTAAILESVTVRCAPAPIAVPEWSHPAYTVRDLRHVDLVVDERRVHIEAIAQTLSGPGGSNTEVRVYVEGRLEGRSILLGRLGGTSNSFPVVASVSPGFLLGVDLVRRPQLDELIVALLASR